MSFSFCNITFLFLYVIIQHFRSIYCATTSIVRRKKFSNEYLPPSDTIGVIESYIRNIRCVTTCITWRRTVRIHHRFLPMRYALEKVVHRVCTGAHAIGPPWRLEEIKPKTRRSAVEFFEISKNTLEISCIGKNG